MIIIIHRINMLKEMPQFNESMDTSKKEVTFADILRTTTMKDLMNKKALFEKDVVEYSSKRKNAMDREELRKIKEDLQVVKDEIARRGK